MCVWARRRYRHLCCNDGYISPIFRDLPKVDVKAIQSHVNVVSERRCSRTLRPRLCAVSEHVLAALYGRERCTAGWWCTAGCTAGGGVLHGVLLGGVLRCTVVCYYVIHGPVAARSGNAQSERSRSARRPHLPSRSRKPAIAFPRWRAMEV